jgi:hypothetical protein
MASERRAVQWVDNGQAILSGRPLRRALLRGALAGVGFAAAMVTIFVSTGLTTLTPREVSQDALGIFILGFTIVPLAFLEFALAGMAPSFRRDVVGAALALVVAEILVLTGYLQAGYYTFRVHHGLSLADALGRALLVLKKDAGRPVDFLLFLSSYALPLAAVTFMRLRGMRLRAQVGVGCLAGAAGCLLLATSGFVASGDPVVERATLHGVALAAGLLLPVFCAAADALEGRLASRLAPR